MCRTARPSVWAQASKADNWQLRHMPKVLDLPFREDISKPNRDNAIDVYIGDTPEDVIGDDVWAETFTVQPAPLTAEEKKAWLSKVTNVALGSDAFFPFGDNIEVCPPLCSRAAPSAMIRLLPPATSTALPWRSVVSGCSTTKQKRSFAK